MTSVKPILSPDQKTCVLNGRIQILIKNKVTAVLGTPVAVRREVVTTLHI